MRWFAFFFAAVVVCACRADADLVLLNGRIWTVNKKSPEVEAVAFWREPGTRPPSSALPVPVERESPASLMSCSHAWCALSRTCRLPSWRWIRPGGAAPHVRAPAAPRAGLPAFPDPLVSTAAPSLPVSNHAMTTRASAARARSRESMHSRSDPGSGCCRRGPRIR